MRTLLERGDEVASARLFALFSVADRFHFARRGNARELLLSEASR
jgi:hypothetical protein